MHRMAVAATRPNPAKHQPTLIAAYEYPASSWGEGSSADEARGGLYVDISDTIDLKCASLQQHKSQMGNDQHIFSITAARALAAIRGIESAFTFAELFYVMRLRM